MNINGPMPGWLAKCFGWAMFVGFFGLAFGTGHYFIGTFWLVIVGHAMVTS